MPTLTYQKIHSILADPRRFYEQYVQGYSQEQRSYLEELIQDLVLFPNVVNDKYTIKKTWPCTVKQKLFIATLADTMRRHLSQNGEITETQVSIIVQDAYNVSRPEEDFPVFLAQMPNYMEQVAYAIKIRESSAIIGEEELIKANTTVKKHEKFLNTVFKRPEDSLPFANRTTVFGKFMTSNLDDENAPLYTCYEYGNIQCFTNQLIMHHCQANIRTLGLRKPVELLVDIPYMEYDKIAKASIVTFTEVVDDVTKYTKEFKTSPLRTKYGLLLKIFKDIDVFPILRVAVMDELSHYVFEFSEKTQKELLEEVEKGIDLYFYHQNTKNYTLPYEYIAKKVQL